MSWVEQTTQRLLVAVVFTDDSASGRRVGDDELRVAVREVAARPIFHRSGYWLVMNGHAAEVTISWNADHFENGETVANVAELPKRLPIGRVALTRPPAAAIKLKELSGATVGKPYRQQVNTAGGKPPLVFEAFDLPEGLVIHRGKGIIYGTPVQRAERDVTLRVTDRNGTQDEVELRMSILD